MRQLWDGCASYFNDNLLSISFGLLCTPVLTVLALFSSLITVQTSSLL